MAWSLPRLLRRLAARARALPARAAARLPRPLGADAARPLVRARPVADGPARPARRSRRSCRARRARADARARRLGADEARRRRAVRRARRRRSTVTPNGVDPAFFPLRAAHAYTARRTCSSSARSRSGRTRSPRSTPRRRSASRSSSPARRRTPRSPARSATRGADLRGYVDEGRARRPLPRGGGARPPVAVRGLRPAGARGDGVRHAGRRRPTTRRCARSAATRPCTPTTATSPARSGARSPSATRLAAAGHRPRAALLVGGDRAPDGRRLPARARAVKVSAVVVSHGHARELERVAAGAPPAGRRARRDRERPGLGPAGRRGGRERRARSASPRT